jgi:hypothetical protein
VNTTNKNSISHLPFAFLAALVIYLVSGCATSVPKPSPNPLEGWHFCSLTYLDTNKLVVDDYQGYIKKLPPDEMKLAYVNHVFEDGTGQHAVQIEIPLNGKWWEHVLFYDKNNKRIKTVKYSSGGFQS